MALPQLRPWRRAANPRHRRKAPVVKEPRVSNRVGAVRPMPTLVTCPAMAGERRAAGVAQAQPMPTPRTSLAKAAVAMALRMRTQVMCQGAGVAGGVRRGQPMLTPVMKRAGAVVGIARLMQIRATRQGAGAARRHLKSERRYPRRKPEA